MFQNHSTISCEQVKATKITTANWIKLLFSFVQSTASHLEACLIDVGPIRPCFLWGRQFSLQEVESPCVLEAPGKWLTKCSFIMQNLLPAQTPWGSNTTELRERAHDKKLGLTHDTYSGVLGVQSGFTPLQQGSDMEPFLVSFFFPFFPYGPVPIYPGGDHLHGLYQSGMHAKAKYTQFRGCLHCLPPLEGGILLVW